MAMQQAGINVVSDESGTYIAATQRPDGSWRKTRKVKPGYVPQDEVPAYESVGTQFVKSKPKLPPGVYEEPKEVKKEPLSKAAKKNEKRKQKRKEKKENCVEDVTSTLEKTSLEDEPVNKEKRLKNVKKKLRQIDELKEKLASGEIKELSEDQQKKVARQKELKDELKTLEALLC
ncbi:partner of Y14 and mago-like [Anneissia japonica]|uniref:partner of Y14 and mago-like n=1 Tax=Anneissia japonica TaxID=1529436 RepID=UPI001425AABC|nr:partner of Y14 and mago-like [Anneissia japonica]XP_033116038.1 partner of Y14 and mago-like [Anneissia japonica]